MMNDILLENPKIKGIIAVLAGPWEGMRTVIEKRARTVIVSTDKVYGTLASHGIHIVIDEKRNAYNNPKKILNMFLDMVEDRMSLGFNPIKEIGYEILIGKKSELRDKILAIIR